MPASVSSRPASAGQRKKQPPSGASDPQKRSGRGISLQPVPYPKHWEDPPKAALPPAQDPDKTPEALRQLLEVTDAKDRTLMYLPQETVLRQNLHCRKVLVALRGKNNTLLLQKSAEPLPDRQGKWDLFACMVRADEAREDAALRLLQAVPGLSAEPPVATAVRQGSRDLPAHTTLFVAELPGGMSPGNLGLPETLLVDEDELFGLVRQIPDLLTPDLIWAAKTQTLFRRPGKR